MIDKSFLIIFIIWYFYTYLPPHVSIEFFIRYCYLCDNFLLYLNDIITEYFEELNKLEDCLQVDYSKTANKEPLKYEDKYLDEIRRLNKDWVFTEEETNELPKLIEDFYNVHMETKLMRLEEITKRILDLKKEIF